jgi:hypothetical protein
MRHAEFVMGTADSISSGRGAREHDERETVCGHRARFIRTVTLSNSTMLRVMSNQTAQGLGSMGSRCRVVGSKFTNTKTPPSTPVSPYNDCT